MQRRHRRPDGELPAGDLPCPTDPRGSVRHRGPHRVLTCPTPSPTTGPPPIQNPPILLVVDGEIIDEGLRRAHSARQSSTRRSGWRATGPSPGCERRSSSEPGGSAFSTRTRASTSPSSRTSTSTSDSGRRESTAPGAPGGSEPPSTAVGSMKRRRCQRRRGKTVIRRPRAGHPLAVASGTDGGEPPWTPSSY